MAAMTECVDSDSSDKFDFPKSDCNAEPSCDLDEDTNPSLSLEGSVVSNQYILKFQSSHKTVGHFIGF